MKTSVFSSTPVTAVRDARGLNIREIQYHRHPDTPAVTDTRITRHQHDIRGVLAHSISPRLYDLMQGDNAVQPDFVYLNTLSGEVLHTRSVDAGTTLALSDAAGRPARVISAIGTVNTWQYEPATLPGRVLSLTEQASGNAAHITERFVYAGHSVAEQNLNLAGQNIRHDDPAGYIQLNSLALSGAGLSQSRQLLTGETFVTQTTADATGTVLATTDAMGNTQRVAYDIAGQLKGSWLTLKSGSEQVIVKSVTYSAAGQKLREEHGNGVVTRYSYEPQTQRLIGIKTERPVGHSVGAKVLQDLRYEYDPVGNVLKVRNDAEETRFWRNQKVVPENTYTYDSLYQLVSASGREMACNAQQGNNLPAFVFFDNASYTNYTRTYTYDRGNNLTQISHSAPASGNNHTTLMTVSHRSNRAMLSTFTTDPTKVDALFTPGGEQKQLQPGQQLTWTPRGELAQVMRDGQSSDRESYQYDAGSQRVVKTSVQQSRTQRVVYLPGLELRTTQNGSTQAENLHTITLGEAGRAQVRVLHWETGKPAAISANNQIRYSYDNLIGSSGLEVDGSGNIISQEEYYPYGGTAVWAARSQTEADYKTLRYSGKERDATGLYYYGYRYYQPWAGRWLSADPAGTVDGLNLYRMVRNNPVTLRDVDGLAPGDTFRGKPVLAKGLDNFAPNERMQVLEALQTAYETLNIVLQHKEELPPLAMSAFFGEKYQLALPGIINRWYHTRDRLFLFKEPMMGHDKIHRAEGSPYVLASAVLDEGNIYIQDFYFSEGVTMRHKSTALIHELSHLGANTKDFFYLKNEFGMNEDERSSNLMRGTFKIKDIPRPNELFRIMAEAMSDRVLKSIDNDEATIGDRGSEARDMKITLSQTLNHLNSSPEIRTVVAAQNADSIAFSAIHIGEILLQRYPVMPENVRSDVARNSCIIS